MTEVWETVVSLQGVTVGETTSRSLRNIFLLPPRGFHYILRFLSLPH